MTAQPHDLGSASLLPTGIKTALSGFVFVVGLALAAPAAVAQTAPYPVISAISDALNRDARIGAAQAQALSLFLNSSRRASLDWVLQ